MPSESPSAPWASRSQTLPQVVFVMGKGGVGKTTLAASIALGEARVMGGAVLVEFGDGTAGRRVLGDAALGVKHVAILPDEALLRGATPLFRSARLARLALGNFAMRSLVRAAPVVRELALLESVRQVCAEHPRYRVVVDMPATGHGLAWLRVPQQGRAYLKSGPLYEYCDRLARELVGPERASVVVVTLPEQLVLEETLELCQAIRSETGLGIDGLIVNRVPMALSHAALEEARALAATAGPLAEAAAALAAVLDARESASQEALAVLSTIPTGFCAVCRIPLLEVDPVATDIAPWLRSGRDG